MHRNHLFFLNLYSGIFHNLDGSIEAFGLKERRKTIDIIGIRELERPLRQRTSSRRKRHQTILSVLFRHQHHVRLKSFQRCDWSKRAIARHMNSR